MRPAPFVARPLGEDGHYVRDNTTGLVWHRVFTRPLYAETDSSQNVYHGNYLRFFELGRASLMRDRGLPYRELEAAGYSYPVIETRLFFHRPLGYDEPIWVHTRPAEIERVKVRWDYVIIDGERGRVLTSGYTRHCAVDHRSSPVEVDATTRALWKRWRGMESHGV